MPQAAQEGLREDRVAKTVEGPAQPHPSAELQVARVGLRGDREVKPEGPMVRGGENHWEEDQGVCRMHPEEVQTQVGLERWKVGLSTKAEVQEVQHPSVELQGVQVV